MARSHIPEALVKLTLILDESDDLRSWFAGLVALPFSRRLGALTSMARRMRADGQDEEIVRAMFSLTQPEIYSAVLDTIEDQGR